MNLKTIKIIGNLRKRKNFLVKNFKISGKTHIGSGGQAFAWGAARYSPW